MVPEAIPAQEGDRAPLAVKGRLKGALIAHWPHLEPQLRELLAMADSPMVGMALRAVAGLLPREGADLLHRLFHSLRGSKDLPSESLSGRAQALVDAIPDQWIDRWGGLLTWVLTGQT